MNEELPLTGRRISLDRWGKLIRPMTECVQHWSRNHRTRRQLSRLDDHQLPDLGLAAVDREIECRKWFWQA